MFRYVLRFSETKLRTKEEINIRIQLRERAREDVAGLLLLLSDRVVEVCEEVICESKQYVFDIEYIKSFCLYFR